jgi:Carboxypeptidase regulatory-like domain
LVIGVRLILAALVLLISAQSQGPPRDPSSATVAKPAGTGVIRGRVVAADTGVPIRRALVTISGGAPGRGTFQTIYTDAQGRSEVRDLAPGSSIVSARPNRYQAQYLPSVTPPSSATGAMTRR